MRVEIRGKRSSKIYVNQFSSYCENFGLISVVRPEIHSAVNLIGGRRESQGTVRIQIKFMVIGLLDDVECSVV